MRIDRIKLACEMAKRDLTVKRLSEITNISRPTISGVKSGKSCTEATARLIAQGLNIDLSELIQKE